MILPWAVVIAAAVAMIFRVFQLLVTVDYSEMGFYSTDSGFIPTWGLFVFMLIALIVFVVCVVKDNKNLSTAFVCTPVSLTPKQTALLGVAFLVGACLKFYMIAFDFSGINLNFIGEALIFAVFAIIGFMLLGSRKLKPAVGYLMLIISISYTIKAAALFMQDTVITRVSDELILMLSYISAVFFFLSLGRFISLNEGKRTRHKLLIFGGVSAVLSACASLSGYIALFVDSQYMASHMALHPISEIGVLILSLMVIFILYSFKKELDINYEPDEKSEENENDPDEMPSV